jgi:hypothetical protein
MRYIEVYRGAARDLSWRNRGAWFLENADVAVAVAVAVAS